MSANVPVDWIASLTKEKPIDPYFVWALSQSFSGYGGALDQNVVDSTEIPFLVERKNHESAVPVFTSERIPLSKVVSVLRDDKLVLRWQLGLARGLENRTTPKFETEQIRKKTKAKVIAAVLDNGCPLFHSAYKNQDGISRVKWLWDQGARQAATPWTRLVNGTDPLYGAELTPISVGDLSSDTTLSEHEKYQKIRYLKVVEKRKHGASVMSQIGSSIAPSGWLSTVPPDTANAIPPIWPIVFVQFPTEELTDTSGGWLGVRVFDGLNYVIARGRDYFQHPDGTEKRVPIVANISYGGLAGPHDGTSMLERAMDYLQHNNPHLDIVLPAGNAYGRDIHAFAICSRARTEQFKVFLPPDNPRATYVEIWLPNFSTTTPDTLSDVNISITPPDGQPQINCNGPGLAHNVNGSAAIVFARSVAHGTKGTMILVAMTGTRVSGTARSNSAGVWAIDVSGIDGEVHAWIERDDINTSTKRAQQARFVGANVSEIMNLSNIANATHTRRFVVGAIDAVANRVSHYSASGPTRALRTGPDFSTISDLSQSVQGIMCEGVRSGERYRGSGTSIAAAVASRHLLYQHQHRSPGPPNSPKLPKPPPPPDYERRGDKVP